MPDLTALSANDALEAIADAVLCSDNGGRVTYLNPAAEDLTGWPRGDALGRQVGEVCRLVHRVTREPVPSPLALAIARHTSVGLPAESVLVGPGGVDLPIEDSTAPIRDHTGAITGAVMVFRHVGAALAQSRLMAHAALHDSLTSLPNRLLLIDRLSTALALASRRQQALAVCFLDVDGFKEINDARGHLAGDHLLQSIGNRLRESVRRSDTVSRYGGDEFVVVLTDVAGIANVAGIVSILMAACAQPHEVDGRDASVTVSLGVSLYPKDGHNAATLIANADAAMYAAKRQGGGRYQLYFSALPSAVAD